MSPDAPEGYLAPIVPLPLDPEFGVRCMEHKPMLMRLALHLNHNDYAGAEDLVQDTFLRAIKYQRSFDGKDLKNWLCRLLKNVYINAYNKAKRQEAENIDALAEVLTDGRGADSEAIARIGIAEALEAVKGMPAYYLEVMRLVVMDDMSYRQAAQVLGIPVNTAMTGMFRARQRLKRKEEGE